MCGSPASTDLRGGHRVTGVPTATVGKLITAIVRTERFSEGHVRAVREAGLLVAILRRLSGFL